MVKNNSWNYRIMLQQYMSIFTQQKEVKCFILTFGISNIVSLISSARNVWKLYKCLIIISIAKN